MRTKWLSVLLSSTLAFSAMTGACHAEAAGLSLNAETKPATQYIIEANESMYLLLDFSDTREFDNAQKLCQVR